MPTTVYFATNRVVTNAADAINGYEAVMVPPLQPQDITYGTAVVDGVDVSESARRGLCRRSTTWNREVFPKRRKTISRIPGRDLLVFIHGFDNTFSDAITRAAFNREWLAASQMPGTDTTVIAFSWPSLGKMISGPILAADYLADQHMAANSGLALMDIFANLQPILDALAAGAWRYPLGPQHGQFGP